MKRYIIKFLQNPIIYIIVLSIVSYITVDNFLFGLLIWFVIMIDDLYYLVQDITVDENNIIKSR